MDQYKINHHRFIAAFCFIFQIIFSIYNNIVDAVPQKITCPVQFLYQLGDSIADTGNTVRLFPYAASRPPYGASFPGYPTGRWSDGRLIIDYIATKLGLPLLNPYLAKKASIFDSGVNFAVAGSTALDPTFFLVEAIINTAREVIKYGASQIVVPGLIPLGCTPWAAVSNDDLTTYDDIGCLKSLNDLSSLMNHQLQAGLDSLRKEFGDAVILYGDYYNAFYSIILEASSFGFDETRLLKPCCGEATYNTLSLKFCGNIGAACPNPKTFVYWDGVHPTQEVYRRMSEILIKDLNITCTS